LNQNNTEEGGEKRGERREEPILSERVGRTKKGARKRERNRREKRPTRRIGQGE